MKSSVNWIHAISAHLKVSSSYKCLHSVARTSLLSFSTIWCRRKVQLSYWRLDLPNSGKVSNHCKLEAMLRNKCGTVLVLLLLLTPPQQLRHALLRIIIPGHAIVSHFPGNPLEPRSTEQQSANNMCETPEQPPTPSAPPRHQQLTLVHLLFWLLRPMLVVRSRRSCLNVSLLASLEAS